ncbi:hypothetical protein GCM10009839_53860 [Catenulispora yoronensis]|uniref:Uncharacterized protein n=1 Tax=Catenulispora yoronensis TaxID=450799 RepID=A0ABN2V0H7_9ACTN
MLPALRVVAVLHALSFLAQPILAGFFLSGQDTAIDSHATNGMILATLCLVMTILAFPVWRRGLVPRAVFTTAAGLLVAEMVQMIAGFSHLMWLHIPLGVIMMGGIATFMPLVMRPQAVAAVRPVAEAGE